jgi:hypothetical protein
MNENRICHESCAAYQCRYTTAGKESGCVLVESIKAVQDLVPEVKELVQRGKFVFTGPG